MNPITVQDFYDQELSLALGRKYGKSQRVYMHCASYILAGRTVFIYGGDPELYRKKIEEITNTPVTVEPSFRGGKLIGHLFYYKESK